MTFNAERETANIIAFIRDYYRKNSLQGAVLGISGGKDSGVVAALLVKALGKENVVGVTMPCHSRESDRNDAKLISDHYGFRLLNVDLTKTFDTMKEEIMKIGEFSDKETLNSDINLKPRLRMATLYYLSALLSAFSGHPYLVAGTSNKCELFVGYFTKGGDSVHDIALIADLTVEEVIQIGEYLEVPRKVLYKVPDDGISQMSDEQKLGVSYREIAAYMAQEPVSQESADKIKRLHETNSHKFNIPTYRRSK